MNRSEVKDATDYLTTQGQHVRVHSAEPGYAVVDGNWVEAKVMRRRYTQGEWRQYQSNFAIRAEVIDADGWPGDKIVVHPRVLVREWAPADESAADKKAKRTTTTNALVRRLRARGLSGVSISIDGKTTTVTTVSLTKALGIEEES